MSWPSGIGEMVDERFYAAQPTSFTVAKSCTWRGISFTVRNSAGDAVMRVGRGQIGYRGVRSLLIIDPASRRPLITLVDASPKRWEAFRCQSTGRVDRLFVVVVRSQFIRRGITLHVFLDGNSSSLDGAPDLIAHSSYLGPMTVSRGGSDVAKISREALSLPPEEEGAKGTRIL